MRHRIKILTTSIISLIFIQAILLAKEPSFNKSDTWNLNLTNDTSIDSIVLLETERSFLIFSYKDSCQKIPIAEIIFLQKN